MLVEDNDAIRLMTCLLYTSGPAAAKHGPSTQSAAACGTEIPSRRDICLPGMSGRDLADSARVLYPSLPIVFMTGFAGAASARKDFLASGMRLLTKPFTLRDLLDTVRTSL
ncbi:response regulator [Xanthomonas campestris]|uniref:response regulator n=1 Tax=Xanthomonas campestris TaxID=339 RepID=UPI003CCFEBE2